MYTAPLRNVAPEELSHGLTQLRRAMDEAHTFLVRELEQRPLARESDFPRLRAIGERINEAEAAIHDTAEVYVFRGMERTALPTSAPLRAWWRVWRR